MNRNNMSGMRKESAQQYLFPDWYLKEDFLSNFFLISFW